MILDDISNLAQYQNCNPRFPQIVEFLKSHNLNDMTPGHYEIDGAHLFVNIVDSPAKTKAEAKLESHQKMIDLQIPISGSEEHGYTPVSKLPKAVFDEKNDIAFYEPQGDMYFTLNPGQFVIYFPQDGHAPAITPTGLRKAIFKIEY